MRRAGACVWISCIIEFGLRICGFGRHADHLVGHAPGRPALLALGQDDDRPAVGLLLLVIATWRWGRKATFAAYSAKHTMNVAELIRLRHGCTAFMERTAVLMAPGPLRDASDRTPALLQLIWDHYGALPRNLIFVAVIHRKVPYLRENRYAVTAFDRDQNRGSLIGVELSFGFMSSRRHACRGPARTNACASYAVRACNHRTMVVGTVLRASWLTYMPICPTSTCSDS